MMNNLLCQKDGTNLSEGLYFFVRRMEVTCQKDDATLLDGW